MRRRLFWTLVGVSALTGLLVLAGAVYASQRAAVDATYREMRQSAAETVAFIQDSVALAEQRPRAAGDVFRALDGDLRPLLSRIRRTAGSSEMAFGVVSTDGQVLSNSPLFDRVSLDQDKLAEGFSELTRSSTGELVVVTPTTIETRDGELELYVALAREAPVVRLGDQGRGLLIVVVGIGLLASLLARLLSSQVADKLEPLAVASRQIADGDMSVRVPDLGDSELDEVARAFNDMAAELEDTREREREFILGVGHDLRTPLTTIGGYSEALEAGDVDADEINRIGGVLGVQTRQMSRLIEDLSTLARLEQPEFSLRLEPVDVGAHLGEVIAGFRRVAEQFGVRLELETTTGMVIQTDPDRVGQIAQNLVENALRFTPEAGTVRVVISRAPGGGVSIAVSDTGSGISEDELPHIFDRHFVGTRRQVRKEGTGLGLSIVRGLVDRLGGTVTAASTLGKGTTITVNLPAQT